MAKKNFIPKNSGDAPSFQFYHKDWLGNHRLKRASKRAKGVWIDLLCIAQTLPSKGVFKDETGAFDREEMLDLLTGNRKENAIGFDELIKRCIIKQSNDGTFYSQRTCRDAGLSEKRRAAGRLGGNPNLVGDLDNQKVNQKPNQKQPPSSSSSTSIITTIDSSNNNNPFAQPNLQPIRPTLDNVKDKALLAGLTDQQAEQFYHHYNSQGWLKANGQPITDLVSALVRWKQNGFKFDKPPEQKQQTLDEKLNRYQEQSNAAL